MKTAPATVFEVQLAAEPVTVPLGASGRALLTSSVPFAVREGRYAPGVQHLFGFEGKAGQVISVRALGVNPSGTLKVQTR